MRTARLALGALGVAAGLWGAWLLRDDGVERLTSTALWLGGGIVLHDFVLAPLVVVIGVIAVRVVPDRHRAVAAVAFLVWGAVTVAVANVLSGQGGKPGMDSLLNRPYLTSWLVLTAVAVGAAMVAGVIRTRRRS